MSHPSDSALPATVPTCPLARDADGNPIELPPGAAAWRVRRKTGGRPRIVLGVDKQPMQLPLSYSIVDLEDVLAPAHYLLDLVGPKGEALGITIAVAIGQLVGSDDDAGDENAAPVVPTLLPTAGSETRLVLEANVRATQLAFQHNQKTLEVALHVAESLRDSVRDMATAQADWIKAIASARGFFRNAPPALPPPPPPKPDEDDDEEDEVIVDERPPAADWVESIRPVVGILAEQVVKAVMGFGKKAAGGPGGTFELADCLDWRRVAAKREAAQAAAAQATATPPAPAGDLASLLGKLPPGLLAKLMQVRTLLSAEEQERAMQLVSFLEPEFLPQLATQLEAMSPEQVAEFLRTQIAKPAA